MSECYFCDPPRYATHRVTEGVDHVRCGESLSYDVCEVCADDYPTHMVTRIPYDKCAVCGQEIERFDHPLCEPCEGSAKAHAKLDRGMKEYFVEARWDRRLS